MGIKGLRVLTTKNAYQWSIVEAMKEIVGAYLLENINEESGHKTVPMWDSLIIDTSVYCSIKELLI